MPSLEMWRTSGPIQRLHNSMGWFRRRVQRREQFPQPTRHELTEEGLGEFGQILRDTAEVGGLVVKQENDTRWNSFYESAKRAIQLKNPLTFSSAEWLMIKTDSNAFLLNIVFGRMTGHFSASRLIFSIHSSVSPKGCLPYSLHSLCPLSLLSLLFLLSFPSLLSLLSLLSLSSSPTLPLLTFPSLLSLSNIPTPSALSILLILSLCSYLKTQGSKVENHVSPRLLLPCIISSIISNGNKVYIDSIANDDIPGPDFDGPSVFVGNQPPVLPVAPPNTQSAIFSDRSA
jgi:hypothetical protein